MPNWVTNILTIYGKTEDVKAMFDRAKADKRNIFTMESFKPMPKTFYETDTTNGVFVTERQFIDEYKKENGCEPVGEVLESLKAKALKKWEAENIRKRNMVLWVGMIGEDIILVQSGMLI